MDFTNRLTELNNSRTCGTYPHRWGVDGAASKMNYRGYSSEDPSSHQDVRRGLFSHGVVPVLNSKKIDANVIIFAHPLVCYFCLRFSRVSYGCRSLRVTLGLTLLVCIGGGVFLSMGADLVPAIRNTTLLALVYGGMCPLIILFGVLTRTKIYRKHTQV